MFDDFLVVSNYGKLSGTSTVIEKVGVFALFLISCSNNYFVKNPGAYFTLQPIRESETSANQRLGTYAPFALKPGQENL